MPVSDVLEKAKRAYGSNDLGVCESLCLAALAQNPQEVTATLLLAFCCVRRRRRDAAVEYFQSALLHAPDSVEAHLGLSTVLMQLGRIEEGKAHGYRAIELEPKDAANRLNLANLLIQKSEFNEALPLWKSLAESAPSNAGYLRNLAGCLSCLRQREQAILVWEKIVKLAPRSIPDWMEFGRLCLADSRAHQALKCALKALTIDQAHTGAQTLAAMAHSEMGEAKQAEDRLRVVLQKNPKDAIATASLGLALQEQGRFQEARDPLQRSIELWPTNGLAYYALVRSQKVIEEDTPLLGAIRQALTSPNVDPLHRSYMRYALGKSFEDLARYEESMNEYDEANRLAFDYWLSHRPWNREKYEFTFNRTIEIFDADRIASVGRTTKISDRPLFVIGMIRAGTTLVEQILSSHPDVAAAGEQTFWHEQAGRIFDPAKGEIDRDQMEKVADEYLALLDSFSFRSARVTDKLPHNYALVGIIKAAIPGARFVHIRRNPLDNCLSIYTTAYQRPPAFTLDRGNIVYAYQQYRRMMSHWRTVVPADSLLEIDYEDLVANREQTTRRMIDFAGLPWDDACLSHEKNERSVHTPSTWQVRQPIYKTSVERWRRFEPWLGEFADLR